jgi:hypothetical protein
MSPTRYKPNNPLRLIEPNSYGFTKPNQYCDHPFSDQEHKHQNLTINSTKTNNMNTQCQIHHNEPLTTTAREVVVDELELKPQTQTNFKTVT